MAYKGKGTLTRFRGNVAGVILPRTSVVRLGKKGQVKVTGKANGQAINTTVFPSGDGRHILYIGRDIRQSLRIGFGDIVNVELTPVEPTVARAPKDLVAALCKSSQAKKAWKSLTPAAKKIASKWIGHAKSQEIREWRISDVIRRAIRYYEGTGPFYPTNDDRAHLGLPRN